MQYLDFLERVHGLLSSPPYLEIGVQHGDSLALARGPAAGIDPELELHAEPPAGATLFEETSDEYFDRPDPLAPLGGERIGLSFIDGMHLVEFVLRDFINVERHAAWSGAVVLDDILPRSVEEAARERRTRAWAGDVYKLPAILAAHRPELICLPVGAEPAGLLLVLGLDPDSRVLAEHYDEIVRGAVAKDPQAVPGEVLERRAVLDPQGVLDASFWSLLRRAHGRGSTARLGRARLRSRVRRDRRRISEMPAGRAVPAPA